ncbi:MAG: hypothetical protein M1840_000876 [Geoglossum simile]|nr:MAG: hypothetical protein M1840_000876 [Geoglossum simile]
MFSLPDSKRVRREELNLTGSSGGEDSADYLEIEGLLKAEFEKSYSGKGCLVSRDNGAKRLGDHVGEEEFEFRLFSSPNVPYSKASSQPPIHKVVLRSPSSVHAEPGFVVSERPKSYYFANTTEREKEIKSIAVEGTDLLDRASVRWPGCALPWRVTTTKMARLPKEPQPDQCAHTTPIPHRKHQGKKRRILLRKKAAMKMEYEERAAKEKVAREAAEREKRTRRNREKKVKKRIRDKTRKAEEVIA